MSRTKKQHFVPRFYLQTFTDESGQLWTHDSVKDSLRQTSPENTGYETNIYSPEDEFGNRVDFIEEHFAKIESSAASILPDLLACKRLDSEAKTNFAVFLATMYARSPAQLRQFATFMGETADWAGALESELEQKTRGELGQLTEIDIKVQKLLQNKDNYKIDVDRRVGLLAIQLIPDLAVIMARMNWTFELSDEQQLVTGDNSVFWVSGGPKPVSQDYGFGLAHRQAVIPFPLSPNMILRLDWMNGDSWRKHKLTKHNAKLANRYQAKHKNRFLYFQTRDEGLRKLAMKYDKPVQQLTTGHDAPEISVVRKLNN